MAEVFTIEKAIIAAQHDTFHSEVITGRAGGSASGAVIDAATNAVTGQVQTTLPKVLRDVGFKPASFTFVTGGTLCVTDADKCIYNPTPAGDNNWYSWGGSLPHTVAPGADPTAVGSGYVPRTDIVLRDQVSPSGAITFTLAQLASGAATTGDVIGVVERPGAKFIVEDGTTPDGYTKLDAGFGRVAVLQYSNVVKASWFGAVTNSAGVRETETTEALNFMFSLAANKAGIAFELDGRYYTNAEIVIPLCVDRAVYELPMFSVNGNNSLISHSHSGNGLVIETSSNIGTRNFAVEIADLYIHNRGTYLTGVGLLIKGSFSALISRVVSCRHEYEFDVFCSSEITFRKCIAHTTGTGIRGNQLSNPYGVDGNDYSVVTYDQFVCFGYENYGIYSNGGGAARHEGGSITSPGLAARSAIHYEGEFRDVSIDDVICETQQLLADGVLSFTGAGLKRSIKISGVTQEVVNASAPSTLIVATGVENITLENIPFNVAAASLANIKYAIIDGAKQVTLINNARTYSYLNKIDLYDVETLIIDNYHIKGRNSDLTIRKVATGEPINVDFAGTFSNNPVSDNLGKSAVTCSAVQTVITQEEYNNLINKKLPMLAVAKIKTSGLSLTTAVKQGSTTVGTVTGGCKADRWKTHLFYYPTDTFTASSSFSNGVRFSGISAASMVGVLSNDDTFTQELYALQADITGGISNWPKFTTIYNASSVPADPIGWINTLGGVKVISI